MCKRQSITGCLALQTVRETGSGHSVFNFNFLLWCYQGLQALKVTEGVMVSAEQHLKHLMEKHPCEDRLQTERRYRHQM